MGETRSKKISITDLYGNNIVEVDPRIKGLVFIDVMHREIHEGEAFIATKVWDDVSDDANADILFETGSTKEAHLQMLGSGGGDFYAYLYYPTTHSHGTELSILQMNLSSDSTSTCTASFGPSGGADGTNAMEFYFPGGTKNQAVGGEGASREEFVIPINTKVLLRLTNKAGSGKPMSMRLTWYEADPIE
jgi:hypothetical protein